MTIRQVLLVVPLLVATLPSPSILASDETDAVKKPECPKGQVWDSKTQQCVLQTSG
ncbi:hypothetical protein [Pseudomonas hamedanensis]|uniref:Chitin-binding type-2 domain-containing protein n=1 Tax=Pseudomonas hamedanensis TaxID=2745504 RepID=A0A9E6P2C5_9PSED|nr:hypothetical protein [Pseudomonas hamedanensis]QXI18103.1 hypothetical protein HU739_003650 [Pseudomonas hamedanensis]